MRVLTADELIDTLVEAKASGAITGDSPVQVSWNISDTGEASGTAVTVPSFDRPPAFLIL